MNAIPNQVSLRQSRKLSRPLVGSEAIIFSRHETPRGPMLATWTQQGLLRIDWSGSSEIEPAATLGSKEQGAKFSQKLTAYFDRDFDALNDVVIDSTGWTPFFRKVYKQCRKVSAGQTISYGELAARAGSPKAARAVGQAMASNRTPLVIPCHRVLAVGDKLGGYSGPGGLNTKRWLLDFESSSSH